MVVKLALTLIFFILFSMMLQDAELDKGIYILSQTEGNLFGLLQAISKIQVMVSN